MMTLCVVHGFGATRLDHNKLAQCSFAHDSE